MGADSCAVRCTGLLLALALLSNACTPLTTPPGRGTHLRYTHGEGVTPAWAQGPGEPSSPEPEGPHRRQQARQAVTAVGSGGADTPAWGNALAAHLALLGAVDEVSASTRRVSRELPRLRASHLGIAGMGNGIFVRYVEYGERQLRWIEAELAAATRLATAASLVDDPDMQLALLRLAGPRLEAAMLGSLLLAVWFDFLHLTDATLSRRLYSVERLYMDMDRFQKLLEPAMTALSSLEPAQVETTADDMPALVGHLTGEFEALREAVRRGAENLQKVLVLKESMEALTLVSALKFTLPALRAAAPATLGMGFMVGSHGVMMGTRMVVSAEWVEMMQRLVRAGVLSLPAVSAAVRIQAGQVMMAHGELPRGVREALGEGPELRGMRVTGKAGAGMAEPPQHHVLPKEFRKWFEKRGFTGEMDIDQFCVRLEQAHHQAIHGGGNWKLGRIWPGEWNRMIMETLLEAETEAGRMLTRNEILKNVAMRMRDYKIPMNFIRWRGR
ncbi:hypothetical protein ATI61_104363 [Archangium gephyra]|uniref:DUF2380 domain-containing protein n=1 Tax=Archangium gephyra TaxID=48 RepID=A0AAC8TBS0_9BACT|nr:DUF2380 domain-containing protein [Archangium gephyra]AKJ00227.1 Hypothetical protein AA314_01853 [Archangium gephyra]REG33073.1 hypothetical protein ATI61_104363 [Archangium gephyra]